MGVEQGTFVINLGPAKSIHVGGNLGSAKFAPAIEIMRKTPIVREYYLPKEINFNRIESEKGMQTEY